MTSPGRFRILLAAFVGSMLLLSACSGDADTTGTDAAPTSTADETPTEAPAAAPDSTLDDLLDPGPDTHLGATWFSPPDPDSEALVRERWEEINDASSIGRVMIDWIEVEPDRGDYRLDDVDEALGDLVDAGLRPMLSVVARDTSGTEFPEWLDGFEPHEAAAAYLAMAEQLVPIMERHGVWMFAIANEPPLAEDDDLDRGDFATFVELVVAGMDGLAPDLATTFTFAGGDPLIDDPDIDRMIAAVDVLSVNHYCLQVDLRVIDLADATANIDRVVERAGDLPVVFQEFGCPASTAMGSSEEYQLAWFEVAFAHIAELEQVRAAFVFEFLDWSQATFDADYGDVTEILVAEIGQGFADRLAEWLLTAGLVRSDGSPRPAFDLYVETAPLLAAADS